MNYLKKIFLVLLFLFSTSNSFGEVVTHVQTTVFDNQEESGGLIAGIEFNNDGTKMFTTYANNSTGLDDFVNEFNLSTPYDISTRTYAGDSERCILDGTDNTLYDLGFSSDGMMLFVTTRDGGTTGNAADLDKAYRYDLTSAYDVSTCTLASNTTDLDATTYTHGSQAGNYAYTYNMSSLITNYDDNRLQGIEMNDDGTKLFLIWMDNNDADVGARLLEYTLSTPYDLTTLSLVTTAGIKLDPSTSNGVTNPASIRFSSNGKRIFVISHADTNARIAQISLDKAYDTSSFSIDGTLNVFSGISGSANRQPRGIVFSSNGLKLYIGNDFNHLSNDQVMEYDLACPFNIISGRCPEITEGDRTGMAEAQIEIARRTIEHSTNTALNRLKWIRRNKDNQNLTSQNIKLNFSNQMLASLSEAVKISTKPKKKIKNQDVFYWSEGSISIGRVGDTDISSTKKIGTNAITIGADKFTKNKGIRGLAFRIGRNDIDIGTEGSNLNTDTYNLTYYATAPIKDDTKFIDTIIGIGALKSDTLLVLDGQNITADRKGKQVYGTVKLKDEIKKDNFTLIPSGQIDLGYTLLDDYQESGKSAMKFEKQSIHSRNARLSIAAVDELENDKYKMKRHGKLEYKANLHRSSNIKYSYVSDTAGTEHDTKLNSGALHNLNGEVGIDIIFPEHYSVFIIYERKHAFGNGYTDNIYIAFGYLPHEDTEYAFSINGSENLMSKFEIKKSINGYDLSFNLNDDLTNLGNSKEASINLNKVF